MRRAIRYNRNLLASRSRSARTARGGQAQKEHEAIYEAIRNADPEQARLAARTHVENTGVRLRSTSGLLKPVGRVGRLQPVADGGSSGGRIR
ncbi:MAG: FCD domain-containing protein [Geminicoccaceae bacterium]